MKLEKGLISDSQLLYSVACFVLGTSLLTAFVIDVTKQETWIVVITGYLVGLLFIWMYLTIAKLYPGKNLVEINEAVFGKVIGKIISSLYILFFLSIAIFNSRDVGNFVVGNIMPETPMIAILIMFIFACAIAVRYGIEVMTRYAFLFVTFTITIIILNTILLAKEIKFTNFLPVFSLPTIKYIQGTHITAIIPFSDVSMFLMVFPALRNVEKIHKPVLLGSLIGFFTLIIVVLRDVAILGPIANIVTTPTYQTIRMVTLGGIVTRFEILYAFSLLIVQFLRISIIFYAVVLGTAQIFELKTYKPLVLTFGIIIICFSMFVFNSAMEQSYWGSYVTPIYSSFSNGFCPR